MAKACGCMYRKTDVAGDTLGGRAAASFPVGGRKRRRSDPGLVHEGVSPPEVGHVIDLFFFFWASRPSGGTRNCCRWKVLIDGYPLVWFD